MEIKQAPFIKLRRLNEGSYAVRVGFPSNPQGVASQTFYFDSLIEALLALEIAAAKEEGLTAAVEVLGLLGSWLNMAKRLCFFEAIVDPLLFGILTKKEEKP